VAAVAAFLTPQGASAHVRTGLVAVDYRANVSALPPSARKAIAIRVYKGDRALGLSVRPGHVVVVLGYLGEPFLRLDAAGVSVNDASLTATGVGLAKPAKKSESTRSVWRLASHRRTVVWHDARLRERPTGGQRREWTVPLVLDGRQVRLAGDLWRVDAPAVWPWIVAGLPFVLLVIVLLLRRRMRVVRMAAVSLGLAASAGLIVAEAGFVFDSSASGGKWAEAGNAFVFALAGVGVIARGSRDARAIAGGALGLLGLSLGLTKIPVFLHGVVLSVYPAVVTRLALAVTIWAGAAAVVVGLAVFSDALERQEDPSARLSGAA
jgi:hypothetical protein